MNTNEGNTSASVPTVLIHEDIPTYALWLKLVLAGILATTLGLAFILFKIDSQIAWVMIGITLFDGLLFHSICVRKYQIYSDWIRIELGRPFALNIPLNTIKEARAAGGLLALAYVGLRFATTTRNTVEILRHGKMDGVISPKDREQFLERLNSALKA